MAKKNIGVEFGSVDLLVGDAVFDFFQFGPVKEIFKDKKTAARYFFDFVYRHDYEHMKTELHDVNGLYNTPGIETLLGITFDQKEEVKFGHFMRIVRKYISIDLLRKVLLACEREEKDPLSDLSDVYERVWNEYEDRTN